MGSLRLRSLCTPRERSTRTFFLTGVWVGPRDGLVVIRKSLLYIPYCTLHIHIRMLPLLTEYTRYAETKIALLFVTHDAFMQCDNAWQFDVRRTQTYVRAMMNVAFTEHICVSQKDTSGDCNTWSGECSMNASCVCIWLLKSKAIPVTGRGGL
jgi:hypothetical protein